jgi:hypothetical protein
MAWVAFSVALTGFLLGWFPLAGFIATGGALLGILDLLIKVPGGKRKGIAITSIVLGAFGTGAAILWTYAIAHASCPHVYAWNGKAWELDADPLSGALLPGAEKRDWDRLESLAVDEGQYRIKIADELEEIDRIDQVALLVVDHAPGTSALPTQQGTVLQISTPVAPLSARDGSGRDVLEELRSADGRMVSGSPRDADPDGPTEPRERITVELPGGKSNHAVLVLRAHSSPFAETAFVEYAARMGHGVGPLMKLAEGSTSYPYRTRIDDELRRLGLPLVIRTSGGEPIEIAPIGPAIQRTFAVPLVLPEGNGTSVHVTFELTPGFWEIDQVALAEEGEMLVPQRLRGRAAIGAGSRDLTELLGEADGRRVELSSGQAVELAFDAPARQPGRERTVVLEILGSYEMDFGGRGWLDPFALLAHRRGRDSLPRFAARLARGS